MGKNKGPSLPDLLRGGVAAGRGRHDQPYVLDDFEIVRRTRCYRILASMSGLQLSASHVSRSQRPTPYIGLVRRARGNPGDVPSSLCGGKKVAFCEPWLLCNFDRLSDKKFFDPACYEPFAISSPGYLRTHRPSGSFEHDWIIIKGSVRR